MMDLDRLSRWTTIASAYAVAAAALYTAGYFQVIGPAWMSMVTTSEMLNLFIASSRNVFILTAETLLIIFAVIKIKDRFPRFSFIYHQLSNHRVGATIFVMSITIAALAMLRSDGFREEYAANQYFNKIMIFVCIPIAASYLLLGRYSDKMPGNILFLVFSALFSCNISGMYAASSNIEKGYMSVIYKDGKKIACKNIVYIGSQGVLTRPSENPKSREYFKGDSYDIIHTTGECPVVRRAPSNSSSSPATIRKP